MPVPLFHMMQEANYTCKCSVHIQKVYVTPIRKDTNDLQQIHVCMVSPSSSTISSCPLRGNYNNMEETGEACPATSSRHRIVQVTTSAEQVSTPGHNFCWNVLLVIPPSMCHSPLQRHKMISITYLPGESFTFQFFLLCPSGVLQQRAGIKTGLSIYCQLDIG